MIFLINKSIVFDYQCIKYLIKTFLTFYLYLYKLIVSLYHQIKINDMKNMEIKINEIAKEAINNAKLEASYYGQEVDLNGFLIELSVLLDNISFENEAAKNMFILLVDKSVSKLDVDFYNTIHPPCFMDKNGNYTYDKSKWA